MNSFERFRFRAGRRLPERGWRAGVMNDAAEVLDTLYTSLEAVAGKEAPVNAVFTLNVVEAVHCKFCGKTTHLQDNTPASPFEYF